MIRKRGWLGAALAVGTLALSAAATMPEANAMPITTGLAGVSQAGDSAGTVDQVRYRGEGLRAKGWYPGKGLRAAGWYPGKGMMAKRRALRRARLYR